MKYLCMPADLASRQCKQTWELLPLTPGTRHLLPKSKGTQMVFTVNEKPRGTARWVNTGTPRSWTWSESYKGRSSCKAPDMEEPAELPQTTGAGCWVVVILSESLLANGVPGKSLRLPRVSNHLSAQTSQALSPVLLAMVLGVKTNK